MYTPQYISLPNDVYYRVVSVAKAYYALIRRQKEIEQEIICQSSASDGMPRSPSVGNPTANKAERVIARQAEGERKIKAIEQAWAVFSEPYQREFIKLNMFENIQMRDINLPVSIRSMKRIRKAFLYAVAENLNEI